MRTVAARANFSRCALLSQDPCDHDASSVFHLASNVKFADPRRCGKLHGSRGSAKSMPSLFRGADHAYNVPHYQILSSFVRKTMLLKIRIHGTLPPVARSTAPGAAQPAAERHESCVLSSRQRARTGSLEWGPMVSRGGVSGVMEKSLQVIEIAQNRDGIALRRPSRLGSCKVDRKIHLRR
jgi:hypothetical protein